MKRLIPSAVLILSVLTTSALARDINGWQPKHRAAKTTTEPAGMERLGPYRFAPPLDVTPQPFGRVIVIPGPAVEFGEEIDARKCNRLEQRSCDAACSGNVGGISPKNGVTSCTVRTVQGRVSTVCYCGDLNLYVRTFAPTGLCR